MARTLNHAEDDVESLAKIGLFFVIIRLDSPELGKLQPATITAKSIIAWGEPALPFCETLM